ncbi:hypothetical protein GCM10027072_41860 [Streptomyces bullii]
MADVYAEAGITAVVRDVVPLGLWLGTYEPTVGETVEAIRAGRQRARVVRASCGAGVSRPSRASSNSGAVVSGGA